MDAKMKTFSAKPAEVDKKWVMIDAEGLTVAPRPDLISLTTPLIGAVIVASLRCERASSACEKACSTVNRATGLRSVA